MVDNWSPMDKIPKSRVWNEKKDDRKTHKNPPFSDFEEVERTQKSRGCKKIRWDANLEEKVNQVKTNDKSCMVNDQNE